MGYYLSNDSSDSYLVLNYSVSRKRFGDQYFCCGAGAFATANSPCFVSLISASLSLHCLQKIPPLVSVSGLPERIQLFSEPHFLHLHRSRKTTSFSRTPLGKSTSLVSYIVSLEHIWFMKARYRGRIRDQTSKRDNETISSNSRNTILQKLENRSLISYCLNRYFDSIFRISC